MSHDALFVVLFVAARVLLALKNRFGLSSRLDRVLEWGLVLVAIWFALEVGGWHGVALLIGAVGIAEIVRFMRKRQRVA
jgi:hypothetical protein